MLLSSNIYFYYYLDVNVGQDISPPNGSKIFRQAGADLMFNCSIVKNETQFQLITQWLIGNISAVGGYVNIVGALGTDNVEFAGKPLPPGEGIGNIINTRNILTIRNFRLDSQALLCFDGSQVYAQFFLFLYCEFDVVLCPCNSHDNIFLCI